MNTTDIAIIGSGMAGHALVREIRKIDPDIAITMITADDGGVYAKPNLSNALAQGRTPEDLLQKTGAEIAAERAMTLLARHRVSDLDVDGRTLVMDGPDGPDRLTFRQLVLATGADPRPFVVHGAETLPSVNSLEDYARWRAPLIPGQRVLIVGAGLIGCEFANDLAEAGYKVDLVDPAPWPLGRLLPEPLGRVLADGLEGAGIAIHARRQVVAIENGMARLDDGRALPFDHSLAAIGLVPRTELARMAGLAVNRGIVVDDMMQTSAEGIHALGDGAETPAGLLPYVLPLMAQARALAKTLTGTPTALHLPAQPVVVKTPACPVVVCPPPHQVSGQWRHEGEGVNRRSLYLDHQGGVRGFALTGTETDARQTLARHIPDPLPALKAA